MRNEASLLKNYNYLWGNYFCEIYSKLLAVLNWNNYVEHIENGLFGAFVFFAAIQFFYYLRVYYPVLFYKQKPAKDLYPISVIICAKNEAANLERNLKHVLEQEYPEFEVVVVNDCSTDNTDEVLGDYLARYNNLRVTSIPLDGKFTHGKKLALTIGIKSAKYEHLVFTDADCYPESNRWLVSMNRGYDEKEIVLGYGGYIRKTGLLNNYIRYDTLSIALSYFGWALAGKPYMGVGRNLAYKKDIFFKNKGFANHYGIQSGDDDLFINEVANKGNTKIIINKNSFTRSFPQKKIGTFFLQKMRHYSTAKRYKGRHVFMLGLEPISRAWFYLLLMLLLTFEIFWVPTLAIAGARALVQFILYLFAGKRFNEKNIWLTYIIFDIYSLFFSFVTYCTLSIRRRYIRWK